MSGSKIVHFYINRNLACKTAWVHDFSVDKKGIRTRLVNATFFAIIPQRLENSK